MITIHAPFRSRVPRCRVPEPRIRQSRNLPSRTWLAALGKRLTTLALLSIAVVGPAGAQSTVGDDERRSSFRRFALVIDWHSPPPEGGIPPDDTSPGSSTPPDDTRPLSVLQVHAGFEMPAGATPPDDRKPEGAIPPDDNLVLELRSSSLTEASWRLSLPAGCLHRTRRDDFVADGLRCGGSLAELSGDGRRRELTGLLESFQARMGIPPDDGRLWLLRLRVVGRGFPADAVPPDPIHGQSRLEIGSAFGAIVADAVRWAGAIPPDDG